MSKEVIHHLLKPKEFATWCKASAAKSNVTNRPSKCNCANCLTNWRTATSGRYRPVRAKHLPNRKDADPDKYLAAEP